MEATGAVLRRSSASACAYVGARRRAARPARVRAGRGGFADEGHLRYYEAAPSARRAVEAPAKHGPLWLVSGGGETQGRSISEAAAFLVKMWDEEEEEMKRREQATEEQMKAAMAGSSSESSDSECDEEDAMKAIKKKAKKAKKAEMKAMKLKAKQEKKAAAVAMACCKDEGSSSESSDSEAEVVGMGRCATLAALRQPPPPPQIPAPVALPSMSAQTTVHCGGGVIEVCLGGKCRKSGSLELLQELEKAAGAAGAVVGCKCMGKCREGPNVRLRGPSSGQTEIKNPLCVGVGVDDVGAIVSGLLGGHDLGGGLMAA